MAPKTITIPVALAAIQSELLARNSDAAIHGRYAEAAQAVKALSCLRTLGVSIDKLDRLTDSTHTP